MVGVAIMPKKYTSVDWSDVPSVLGVEEVAELLGVHFNTVKRLIYSNQLPSFKIGRISKINKADLMNFAGVKPLKDTEQD